MAKLVLIPETSKDFNELQFLNILFILEHDIVLKDDISKEVKEVQPTNISFISPTNSVLKLLKSNFFNELHE